jgi:hypothetical protein
MWATACLVLSWPGTTRWLLSPGLIQNQPFQGGLGFSTRPGLWGSRFVAIVVPLGVSSRGSEES